MAVPGATPYTNPAELTVATAVLLLLQEPPDMVLLYQAELPASMLDEPDKVPALPAVVTIIYEVAITGPQVPEME